jgi:hypothetical protein
VTVGCHPQTARRVYLTLGGHRRGRGGTEHLWWEGCPVAGTRPWVGPGQARPDHQEGTSQTRSGRANNSPSTPLWGRNSRYSAWRPSSVPPFRSCPSCSQAATKEGTSYRRLLILRPPSAIHHHHPPSAIIPVFAHIHIHHTTPYAAHARTHANLVCVRKQHKAASTVYTAFSRETVMGGSTHALPRVPCENKQGH